MGRAAIGLWFCALLGAAFAAPAEAVEGTWITDPDQALAAAKKVKKPILAVAMDHA